MTPTVSKGFKNLPANDTETSTLKELLDGDLEHRSFILRRQGEVRSRSSYAEKAAKVFAHCLVTTNAVKEAYAVSIQSTKALKEALINVLNLDDDDKEILTTISSTKGIWRHGLRSGHLQKLCWHPWTGPPRKLKPTCTSPPTSKRRMNPPILRRRSLCCPAPTVFL